MNSEIILKYLTQECTEQELALLNEWLAESNDNRQWLFELKVLWDKRTLADFSRREYLDKQFDITLQKIFRSEKEEKVSRLSLPRAKKIIAWVAAACLLAFVVNTVFVKTTFLRGNSSYVIERVSAGDSIRRITLPDHSIVWLSANSEIKYLPGFTQKERRVILSGEGYFDVQKNPDKPFRVETPEFTVKVLGTRFNVSCDNTRQTTDATLFSGKVVIENGKQQELLVLTPGQKVSYSKSSKQMLVENIEPENNGVLLENKYISFKGATLQSIIKELQYVYGASIIITGGLNNSASTYTGAIQREDSLEAVLRGLQNVIPFSFEENKDGSLVLKKKS